MSKDRDEVMGHGAENDGIEEYDNPLPDWWLGMFFFTILFAIGYTVEYHFVSDRSQASAYDAEVAAADVRWPKKAVGALTYDDASLAKGKEVFDSTCAVCHGPDLTGKIGPSLVDAEWIHGNTEQDVVKVISEGVADKGMPTWGPVLGPEKVSTVAAYVLSKRQ